MKVPDEAVLKYLKDHPVQSCELCRSSWTYDNTLYEMREFTGGGMVIGGGANLLTFVALICHGCGNTKFINAVAAGFIDNQGRLKNVGNG